MIGDAGLTTREACGNTVRNVVAHPTAGVSKDEVFDVSPYAAAYARYFLRHPTTQNMPRKSKTAFSGSEKDEAMTPFHDMGFIARERDGKRGFKIVVGGGSIDHASDGGDVERICAGRGLPPSRRSRVEGF